MPSGFQMNAIQMQLQDPQFEINFAHTVHFDFGRKRLLSTYVNTLLLNKALVVSNQPGQTNNALDICM